MSPASWHPEVQAPPAAPSLSLSRAGVIGVEKVIRLGTSERQPTQLFAARLGCVVDLGPDEAAEHAPRFEEVLNDAVGEIVLHERALRAEQLARLIVERVRGRLGVPRAEVTIVARAPEHKEAPVSGIRTQEIYTLHVSAVASRRGIRRLVGVTTQGMVVSPVVQQLMADSARRRLTLAGFSEEEVRRILEAVPLAADNQRGFGTLHVGCPEDCEADIEPADLLDIVEGAMSSEIYELMKRSDEGAVVEKAHQRARSAGQVVRAMLTAVVERHGGLPDDVFVAARQENTETMHQHNVVAERFGLLGQLRDELASGRPVAPHGSTREWLEAAGR
jgi:GTP cyclohydrolase-4